MLPFLCCGALGRSGSLSPCLGLPNVFFLPQGLTSFDEFPAACQFRPAWTSPGTRVPSPAGWGCRPGGRLLAFTDSRSGSPSRASVLLLRVCHFLEPTLLPSPFWLVSNRSVRFSSGVCVADSLLPRKTSSSLVHTFCLM